MFIKKIAATRVSLLHTILKVSHCELDMSFETQTAKFAVSKGNARCEREIL